MAMRAESERDWRFVRSMLFDDAAGVPRRVERWLDGPRLALIAERKSDFATFVEVVQTANMILAPAGVRLVPDKEFDILVLIKSPEQYHRDRVELNCGNNDEELFGVACIRAVDDHRITQALVLASNDWHPEMLRSTLMEEMFHALGVPNHTTEESTSLLYHPPEGRPALQRVSRLDAQLLLFLYTHLQPGDDEAAVRRAFDRHWAGMELPPLSGPLVRGDLDPLEPERGRRHRSR